MILVIGRFYDRLRLSQFSTLVAGIVPVFCTLHLELRGNGCYRILDVR